MRSKYTIHTTEHTNADPDSVLVGLSRHFLWPLRGTGMLELRPVARRMYNQYSQLNPTCCLVWPTKHWKGEETIQTIETFHAIQNPQYIQIMHSNHSFTFTLCEHPNHTIIQNQVMRSHSSHAFNPFSQNM